MHSSTLHRLLCRCVALVFSLSFCLNPARFGVDPETLQLSFQLPVRFEFISNAFAETLDELDPAIGVIALPSVPSIQAVQNGRMSIRYVVFNFTPKVVDNVLLESTFGSGVSVRSSEPAADSSGSVFRWSVGSLPAIGSKTFTVEIELSGSPTSLDGGAAVFGTVDGRAVRNFGHPATLRSDNSDPAFLSASPGADTEDRYVLSLAARLHNDPARIFQFVRDGIRFESYQGALRGARGVIWSGAGNALDRASLLVALLRASGIPARYVRGTLSLADQKKLIRSMFTQVVGVVGTNDPALAKADPESDSTLLAETSDHFWVELESGGNFVPADPSFPEGAIGVAPGSQISAPFASVPEQLNHTVTLRLTSEFFSQASALFGFGASLSSTPQLEETFRTVDIVGRPLTIGNHVAVNALPNPVFSYQTTTYTPYVVVDQNDSNVIDDQSIEGAPYTETVTSFPLGSNILTGVFLEVETRKPDGSVTTSERTIVDRIGYDIRQNGGTPNIDFNGPPPIGPTDTTVLNVAVSDQFKYLIESRSGYLQTLRSSTDALETALKNLGNAPLASDPVFAQQSNKRILEASIVSAQLTTQRFLRDSDLTAHFSADSLLVRSYADEPRLIFASTTLDTHDASNPQMALRMDLRKDSIRVVPAPGQPKDVAFSFRQSRGFFESELEDRAVKAGTSNTPVSTFSIFQAAVEQGIGFAVLSASNPQEIDNLAISPQAKSRISQALASGKYVQTPAAMVNINGHPEVGWFEVDPTTGETISVLEDGSHGGDIVWYAGAHDIVVFLVGSVVAFGVGAVAGGLVALLLEASFLLLDEAGNVALASHHFLENMLGANPSSQNTNWTILTGKAAVELALAAFPTVAFSLARLNIGWIASGAVGVAFAAGFWWGLYSVARIMIRNLKNGDPDPSLLPFQTGEMRGAFAQSFTDTTKSVSANVGGSSLSVNRGAQFVRVSGTLASTWTPAGAFAFPATSLSATSVTVRDGANQIVGTGALATSFAAPVEISVTAGTVSVSGNGSVAFYPPSGGSAGSAVWTSFHGIASGSVLARVNGPLTVGGTTLQAAMYTIEASTLDVTGAGDSGVPNFLASAQLSVNNGSLEVGPGTGGITIDGAPVSTDQGVGATGFAGTLTVSPGANAVGVSAAGTFGKIVMPNSAQHSFSVNQLTNVEIAPIVTTSAGQDYNFHAVAPPDWIVSFGTNGNLTIQPAAGLQNGEFEVHLAVSAKDDPSLVAGEVFKVQIGATAPGVDLTLVKDIFYTLPDPLTGVDLPTTFQATVRNDGPTTDTFALSFDSVPPGFSGSVSTPILQIKPGQHLISGVYLLPNGGVLPPPGTALAYTLRAQSSTNPAVVATQTINFTMPEVHSIRIDADPASVSVAPGNSGTIHVTFTALGNVPEQLALTGVASPGLNVTGLLNSVPLAIGGSASQDLTLTPAANVPLGTNLAFSLRGTYGPADAPRIGDAILEARVSAPGVDVANDAALNAAFLGYTGISGTLNNLSSALTALFLNPSDTVAQGQVTANFNSLVGQLDDPIFAQLVAELNHLRDSVAGGDQAAINAALAALPNLLGLLGDYLDLLAKHNIKILLMPNSQVQSAGQPASFALYVINSGKETTKVDFTVGTLPGNVMSSFNTSSLTLAPGEISNGDIVLQLQQSGSSVVPFEFDVFGTVDPGVGAQLVRSAHGSLTVRDEAVQVSAVKLSSAFVNPGSSVSVSARVIALINTARPGKLFYEVLDTTNAVVFTSQPSAIQFAPDGYSTLYTLPTFNSTGLANGQYQVRVTATEEDGTPLPGAQNFTTLLVGTPLEAALTINPDKAAPGTNTVQATLHVKSIGGLGSGLQLLGSTAVNGASGGFAIKDDRVYIGGSSFGDIADISDPTHPIQVGTFGSGLGIAEVALAGAAQDRLVTGIGVNPNTEIRVFDLTNPLLPALQTPSALVLPNHQFFSFLYPHGDRVYATYGGFRYFLSGTDIFNEWGGATLLDVSSITSPQAGADFYTQTKVDNVNPPITINGAGDGYSANVVDVSDTVAYHVTTNAPQTDPGSGVGVVRIFDLSAPASPVLDHELLIPNTGHILSGARDGNQVLLIGTSGGINDPGATGLNGAIPFFYRGNLVLTVLDVTDPLHPVISSQKNCPDLVANFTTRAAPAGGGKWFIGERLTKWVDENHRAANQFGAPLFGLVDTSAPGQIQVTTYPAFPGADGYRFTVHKGNLVIVAPPPAGLLIYSLSNPSEAAVMAAVDVPKTNGVSLVPGSFNLAPSSVLDHGTYDTLVWEADKFPFPYSPFDTTLTWSLQVSALQAVEARQVLQSGIVNFTYQGSPGSIDLGPQFLSSGDVVDVFPSTQTVQPGEEGLYSVSVHNPSNASLTLSLGVAGLESSWYFFEQPTITLPPLGDSATTLHVKPDSGALLGTSHFSVLASRNNETIGAASAELIVAGDAILPSTVAQGVLVELVPSSGTAGSTNGANFTVRVTNTGSGPEDVDLTSAAPAFDAFFGEQSVRVLPGKANAQLVSLTLLPKSGTPIGFKNFSVTGAVAGLSGVTSTASGVVNVVNQGVALSFDSSVVSPQSTVQLRVVNSGVATDTFNLALAGPAAPFASLAQSSVTLGSGQSTNVTVTLGQYDLVGAGDLSLVAVATSISSAAVRARAETEVRIPETIGLSAHFTPAVRQLATPGSTSFLLEIDNAGNNSEVYTAAIVGTSGEAQASLVDQDGTQGGTIPLVRLPALGRGVFLLNASMVTSGTGTITVRVSQSQAPVSQPSGNGQEERLSVRAGERALKSVDVTATIQVAEGASQCVGQCDTEHSTFDEDHDGVPNCQEIADKTDPCDSGSHVTQLQPSSCAGANGFLGQVNIATVLNHQSTPLGVTMEYRDQDGMLRGQVSFSLPALLKRDIIVNDLGLKQDSYGTVCVFTDAGSPNGWSGGMTIYKRRNNVGPWNPSDEFDFALYYPFQSPQTGRSNWSINTNTVGTDGLGTVANWIRIADAVAGDSRGVTGALVFYDIDGNPLSAQLVRVPDGGRVDFAAHAAIGAHKIGQAEFVPDDLTQEYYIETTRYFYEGVGASSEKFYTAFSLPNRPLTGAVVTGKAAVLPNQLGVVEMINGSDASLNASLKFFNAQGSVSGSSEQFITKKGSAHQIVNALNAFSDIQSAQVSGPPESIAATTVIYQLNDSGKLQFAYAPPFTESAGAVQLTEFNSFIQHQNILELDNSTNQQLKVNVQVVSFDRTQATSPFEIVLAPKGSERRVLKLPEDTYGTIIVDSNGSTGVVVRNDVARAFQYILPFLGN
ncbi:MAG: transglutaminase family protein [Bdellovibrionota bacterium]